MKPWQAGGTPTADEMHDLVVVQNLTSSQIAERFGVTRQAVDYWKDRTGFKPSVPAGGRLNHKKYLPWAVKASDSHDFVARALRGYSSREQGRTLRPEMESQVNRLIEFLTKHDVVVTYDRESGFYFVPRREGEHMIREPESLSA